MRHFLSLILFLYLSLDAFSQNLALSGTIFNKETNESIIGAKINAGNQRMAISDVDGNFTINLEASKTHELKITFIGYDTLIVKVQMGTTAFKRNFYLSPPIEITIDEVTVMGDMAKTRETPIAFSKLTSKQIAEDLGTRDLPMILNSTPGAYATEQGGGVGDARVTIRGFDQRNIAVLVDGVPVNDMENGQVYWSNWDGLGDITKYMQVQRGLGASKLAIISVGGTMNVVTKGIDQKRSTYVKNEVNNYGLNKFSFGYNSGMLKGNWGYTFAGARKWGASYADATFSDAWSYFFKIQKKINRHLITFGVNGAPQSHGQRTTRLPIAVVDKNLAESVGINYTAALDSLSKISSAQFTTMHQGARGIQYSPNYGIMNDHLFYEKVNYFHKPQFNLNHLWTINEKTSLSTVAYMSIGSGGGTSFRSGGTPSRDTTTGLYNLQNEFDYNSQNISSLYSNSLHSSNNYLVSSVNNHHWIGLLSTMNVSVDNHLSFMMGFDGRYYRGEHYRKIYDLMGGDYAIDYSNLNQPKGKDNIMYAMKKVGDKVAYNYDATVKWLGTFGQVEYKKDKWSAFMTSSVSQTAYQRFDYFKKKDLVLSDTIMNQVVGYGDTILYKGVKYTNQSDEARYSTTNERWFLGGTIKGGANYNIDKFHNVFFNAGFLSIAPRLNTVFDNNNREFKLIENQKVYAIELGYGLKSSIFSLNANLYFTLWKNKPPQFTPSIVTPDGTFSYNINGLDALHKGLEIDFIYKISKKIDFEGLVSIADWRTISGNTVNVTDENNNIVAVVDFSAKNVHVGDAAQIQLGGSIRYEIFKNLYVKLRFTQFEKNYANFDPITLTLENKDRDSWKMPNYNLLDFNMGYEMKFGVLNFGIMNLMDKTYITDAQNGAGFNASSALVFVGMGRRYNLGLKINI